jgi:glycosyltransferase involved in cell wall biosynthesis
MNFRRSSGHGIFMLGVIQTLQSKGHFIDIVLDGEPEENFVEQYNVNIYTPDKKERMGYTNHNNLFQFADSFNFEKALNFRNSITKALSNHIYDLIICNDTESAIVCHQMGLGKIMNLASYAHECESINPELSEGVFKDSYYDLIQSMMTFPDVITLVQTNQNLDKLEQVIPSNHNCYVLPYPLTDSTPINIGEKDGILFIGRHEDRKNPAAFIKLLAGIKEQYGIEVKANVLTRSAHVKKFEEDFKSIGHTNYEIRADVVGKEKSELIQSSKVAFMPYKNESFGIAVLEALRFMPTVVLSKYNWHYNFDGFSNLIKCFDKELVSTVWSAYNNFYINEQSVNSEFESYQKEFEKSLMLLVLDSLSVKSKIEPRNRLYKYLQDNKGTWISLDSYFTQENKKGCVYLTSDIETLYTGKGWFDVNHTNEKTYVGIPDKNGKINFPTNSITNNSETFTSFFE